MNSFYVTLTITTLLHNKHLQLAICKRQNGKLGKGMRRMMGMRGIRVECGESGRDAGNRVGNAGNMGWEYREG